jgi:Xaa-Pro dipeptidase
MSWDAIGELDPNARHAMNEGAWDPQARILTKAGYTAHFLNACGYAMGATYPPTWMDWPMVYAGEPQVLAPNMVFFLHMILLNGDTGLGMSLGETAIITETGCEPISRTPRDLLVAEG